MVGAEDFLDYIPSRLPLPKSMQKTSCSVLDTSPVSSPRIENMSADWMFFTMLRRILGSQASHFVYLVNQIGLFSV